MAHFLGNLAVFQLKIFIVVREETLRHRREGTEKPGTAPSPVQREAAAVRCPLLFFWLLAAHLLWHLALQTACSQIRRRGALRRAPLGAPLPWRWPAAPRLLLRSAPPLQFPSPALCALNMMNVSELPLSSHLHALPAKRERVLKPISFYIKFYQNALNCMWIF